MPVTNLLILNIPTWTRATQTLGWKVECRFSGEETENNGVWEAENPLLPYWSAPYHTILHHTTPHCVLTNIILRVSCDAKNTMLCNTKHVPIISSNNRTQYTTPTTKLPYCMLQPLAFYQISGHPHYCLANSWRREIIKTSRKNSESETARARLVFVKYIDYRMPVYVALIWICHTQNS